MYILISGIIGLLVGSAIGFSICFLSRKRHEHSGTIKVIPEEGRLIYSLELHEDPIMLQEMREVVFKVETSDESSDRN